MLRAGGWIALEVDASRAQAAAAGLMSVGVDVIDLGMVPTPTVQLAVEHQPVAVVVTKADLLGLGFAYLVLGALVFLRDRAHVVPLVRDGLWTPYRDLAEPGRSGTGPSPRSPRP